MSQYQPGRHILATFHASPDLLSDTAACRQLFDRLVTELGLVKVGEVYHEFDSNGFTATVCLTESHVSIHTWPEYGYATFDVFLSNYRNDNSEKAEYFYEQTRAHFKATTSDKQTLHR